MPPLLKLAAQDGHSSSIGGTGRPNSANCSTAIKAHSWNFSVSGSGSPAKLGVGMLLASALVARFQVYQHLALLKKPIKAVRGDL